MSCAHILILSQNLEYMLGQARSPKESSGGHCVESQLGMMGSDLQGAYTSLYYMPTKVAGDPFPGSVSLIISISHMYVR